MIRFTDVLLCTQVKLVGEPAKLLEDCVEYLITCEDGMFFYLSEYQN